MKTIKININIYSPKELWVKFWNRFFWPRRKQCAEWMDFAQGRLTYAIVDETILDYYNKGLLSESITEQLDLTIKSAIEKECETVKEIMSKTM